MVVGVHVALSLSICRASCLTLQSLPPFVRMCTISALPPFTIASISYISFRPSSPLLPSFCASDSALADRCVCLQIIFTYLLLLQQLPTFGCCVFLLGDRTGIWPVKKRVVGCWRGCLGWGADLHIAQHMSLPLTISCSSKSRLVLTLLVLPFCYLLTRVVPDIFQKSSKTSVVCVCVFWWGW